MSRKKSHKELPVIQNLLVEDIAAEGKCIARYNEKVIFIDKSAPGDIADIKILKDKKSFAEGTPVRFEKYSELREVPFCEHFGVCGGCKWQHLKYEVQLLHKEKQVRDQLERIGKINLPGINPIMPAKTTKFYRNKLEYTFSSKRWLTTEELNIIDSLDHNALGFHIPGRFDKVIDIQHCYLQPEPSNDIRLEVRRYAKEKGLSFFDLKKQEGLLRNLIIRTAITTGETMVIVQFYYNDPQAISDLLQHLKEKFPQITSLLYIINSKGNETFHDQEVITYYGRDHIYEEMEGLRFKIGPKSFYQTNSEQAYELYKEARRMAGLQGHEIVYDLYTGTGTIANFVAKQAAKVIGVEYVAMAIEDAKENSRVNNISNTLFFAGDMKDVLNEEFVKQHGTPDVIITDPPRAGMHEDVVKMLLNIAPQRIVYVSCNPATQARDLALLDTMYEVKEVQPVDMFPHTQHVENIVLLHKK